jgi:hypothetical protein
MAMDKLDVWIDEITGIKPGDKNLTSELADKIDQRVTGKLQLSLLGGPPASFTWKKELFVKLIENLPASQDTASGLKAFADAWQAATMASTLQVGPGAFIGTSSPPTLFSVVMSSILVPASVMAASQALLAQLSSASPLPDAKLSPVPSAFFSAFSSLQAQVVGLDSTPTPAGPLPLTIVSPVI